MYKHAQTGVAPSLAGYELADAVFEGGATCIRRARRIADGQRVMLKSLHPERTTCEALARLQREYDVMARLTTLTTVRALALEQCRDQPVLVIEDFGGESLDRIVRRHPLELETLLSIAVQVAAALADIHSAGIIHKDINPSNIVYNRRTGAVKVIDFSIAALMSRDDAGLEAVETPEGSLPYISPEQTGRMNRAVDYRSDFYSLGVTLYELLTQRPLFSVSDPIEWLHCHIAKPPRPPIDAASATPRALSDLVMRLLAKTPEERYQSALGIKADLQHCLDQLRETGRVEPFALGVQDAAAQFRIPPRLYGRERPLAQLMDAFERAAAGTTELVIVHGAPGVGKTRLVEQLYPIVTGRGGFFICGAFARHHQNLPYSAVAGAFGGLLRQLLGGSETQVTHWREALQDALGSHGRLVTEVVREVELLVGPQPPLPEMAPEEARLLFHRVFLRFVRVFCRREHPLVLFLDDQQWADGASLQLADMITGDNRPGHLMVIGAFRDTEVDASHPLTPTLTQMRATGVHIETIELGALEPEALGGLIADTLHTDIETARPLARLVQEKTGSNPLFAEEFLELLYRERLIGFDISANQWRWDIEQIAVQEITDNVVGLMAGRLEGLAPDARRVLELGACIGGRFELQALADLSTMPLPCVVSRMREAVDAGVLMIIGDQGYGGALETVQGTTNGYAATVAFVHDRIRQTAYDAMPPEQRRAVHLDIARLLAGERTAEAPEQQLFELLHHYNIGQRLIQDRDERMRLCALNVDASRQARAATAYAIAFDYLETALALLPPDAVTADYDFALGLYIETAEAAYLCGNYKRMQSVIDRALAEIDDVLDQVKLQEIRMAAHLAQAERFEAIELARRLFRQLGAAVTVPRRARRWHAIAAMLMVRWKLRGKSADDFRRMPMPRSRRLRAMVRLGSLLGSAAYQVRPDLYLLMVYGGITAAATRQYCTQPMVYASFAVLQCTDLGQIRSGQEFAALAIELAERQGVPRGTARALFMYAAFVRHWCEPLQSTVDLLDEAHRLSMAAGDFNYAMHANCIYGYHAFYSGMHLGRFAEQMSTRRDMAVELEQGALQYYCAVLGQMASNLMGESNDPLELTGISYDETVSLPRHEAEGDKGMILCAHVMKMQLAYLFGAYERARAAADIVHHHKQAARGNYGVVVFYFFDALNCLALCRTARGAGHWRLLRRAQDARRRLRIWSAHNPDSNRHKLCLIEAEYLRLRDDRALAAHALYDQSIARAQEQGFVQDAALAAELAAQMHVDAGRVTIAEPYLQKARSLYRRWGAHAKVRDLEQRHAILREAPAPALNEQATTHAMTRNMGLADVDMTALIKALKTITDERVHSRMVEAIIATAVEFAGAQNGALILRSHKGELCLEAQSTVDAKAPRILQSLPMAQCVQLSQRVVNYVARSGKSVVIGDARQPDGVIPGLHLDDYVQDNGVRSILCLPVFTGADGERELIGLLYLENNSASNAFTEERFGMLEVIGMAGAGRVGLARRAAVDGLTQLYNHDYFQTMLRQEFRAATRLCRPLAVILADIDHFKRFNDSWGHQLGDQVLNEIGELFNRNCREADIAARYGGEEMALILPNTELDDAAGIAERIRSEVEQLTVAHQDSLLRVTLSLGVACVTGNVADEKTLIRKADEALYRAKHAGRNRVTLSGAPAEVGKVDTPA